MPISTGSPKLSSSVTVNLSMFLIFTSENVKLLLSKSIRLPEVVFPIGICSIIFVLSESKKFPILIFVETK